MKKLETTACDDAFFPSFVLPISRQDTSESGLPGHRSGIEIEWPFGVRGEATHPEIAGIGLQPCWETMGTWGFACAVLVGLPQTLLVHVGLHHLFHDTSKELLTSDFLKSAISTTMTPRVPFQRMQPDFSCFDLIHNDVTSELILTSELSLK
eukprot:1544612-Amphidinium_carterae.3